MQSISSLWKDLFFWGRMFPHDPVPPCRNPRLSKVEPHLHPAKHDAVTGQIKYSAFVVSTPGYCIITDQNAHGMVLSLDYIYISWVQCTHTHWIPAWDPRVARACSRKTSWCPLVSCMPMPFVNNVLGSGVSWQSCRSGHMPRSIYPG